MLRKVNALASIERTAGFTLLELLLSLTIIAVIMVVLFGGLRVGIRAWEKGEDNVEHLQHYRPVFNLIQRQVAAMDTTKIQGLGNKPFFIRGSWNKLAFLSRVSLIPGNDLGMVFVEYRITTDEGRRQLKVFEKNYVLLRDRNDQEMISDEEFLTLLDTPGRFRFEYLPSIPNETEPELPWTWAEEWEGEEIKKFPEAIRISFHEDEDSLPIRSVISIRKGESE